jgi:nitrogen fixation-related uncharacterized protein
VTKRELMLMVVPFSVIVVPFCVFLYWWGQRGGQ